MILIFLTISAITIIVATSIIIKSDFKNTYKFFSVFLIFLMMYSGWYYAQSVYGYAYNHSLPDKFQLIWGQEIQQNSIELWVNAAQGNGFSHNSRLYTIPWSQQNANALEQAKKSLTKGIPVIMGKGNSKHQGQGGIAGVAKNALGLLNNNSGGENLNFLPNTEQLPEK